MHNLAYNLPILKTNKKRSWQSHKSITGKDSSHVGCCSWQKQLAVGKNIFTPQALKPYQIRLEEQLATSWQNWRFFLPTANHKILPSQIYSGIRAVGKNFKKSLKKMQLATLSSHYSQWFDP